VRGKVFRSVQYKNWHRDAAITLAPQIRRACVFGAYELNVKLTGRRKRGDCDNRLKAVNDLLQSVGVIVDDKLCTRAAVERADIGAHDCLITVTGEIAYKDRWEFVTMKAKAEKKLGRR
jgi:Holliday junction resolvase RusA-like endonuclease